MLGLLADYKQIRETSSNLLRMLETPNRLERPLPYHPDYEALLPLEDPLVTLPYEVTAGEVSPEVCGRSLVDDWDPDTGQYDTSPELRLRSRYQEWARRSRRLAGSKGLELSRWLLAHEHNLPGLGTGVPELPAGAWSVELRGASFIFPSFIKVPQGTSFHGLGQGGPTVIALPEPFVCCRSIPAQLLFTSLFQFTAARIILSHSVPLSIPCLCAPLVSSLPHHHHHPQAPSTVGSASLALPRGALWSSSTNAFP